MHKYIDLMGPIGLLVDLDCPKRLQGIICYNQFDLCCLSQDFFVIEYCGECDVS